MTGQAEKPALIVSLTPALQETRVVDRLRVGDVNRCRSVTRSDAGKGVNVARVIEQLGGRAVLTGFGKGVPVRVCVTIRDEATGAVTELVEEAPLPAPDVWRAFYRQYDRQVKRTGYVVMCGALMPGAPANVYAKLAAAASCPVIIDSQREPLLRVLRHRPFLVKLNAHELQNTLGKAGPGELLKRGALNVLVTDGAKGARLVTPAGKWDYRPPRIKPVNPIGSGDAVTAGIVVGLQRGQELPEAVRLGIACGTANALTPTSGYVVVRDVRRLLREVESRSRTL
jgi:tagatose 6-phosphate kinase